MAEPYRTRTTVLFAAGSDRAVLLRRGPRKLFRLIGWDTGNDSFTPGQWMRGQVELSDLSPGGDKLLYWAAQYHVRSHAQRREPGAFDPATLPRATPFKPRGRRKVPRYLRPLAGAVAAMPRRIEQTWTAVSRPPYFTALALWPSIGTWTGGGVFRSEREIVLWEPVEALAPAAGVALPNGIAVRSVNQLDDGAKDFVRSAYRPALAESEEHGSIAEALTLAGLSFVDWISLRRGRDMLFAGDGRIWCLERWASVAPADYLGKARLLADFREMSFEPITPPDEAMQW